MVTRWRKFSRYCQLGALLSVGWLLYPTAECTLEFGDSGQSSIEDRNNRPRLRPAHIPILPNGHYTPQEPRRSGPFDSGAQAAPVGTVARIGSCLKRYNPLKEPETVKLSLLGGFLGLVWIFNQLSRRALVKQRFKPK